MKIAGVLIFRRLGLPPRKYRAGVYAHSQTMRTPTSFDEYVASDPINSQARMGGASPSRDRND